MNVMLTESTVTRILLRIEFFAAQNAVTSGMNVTVGITPVTEQANAVGGTSIPDPAAPGGIDWLFWTSLFVPTTQIRQTGGTSDEWRQYLMIERDLRGQRKLTENNTDIILVMGDENNIGPTVSVSASVLVRLP